MPDSNISELVAVDGAPGEASGVGGSGFLLLNCESIPIFRPVNSTNRKTVSMREVQASDAKTRLAELLTAVERGETIVIRRHGRAIARLVPESDLRQAEIDRAVDDVRRLRATAGKASLPDILDARHEGHQY